MTTPNKDTKQCTIDHPVCGYCGTYCENPHSPSCYGSAALIARQEAIQECIDRLTMKGYPETEYQVGYGDGVIASRTNLMNLLNGEKK